MAKTAARAKKFIACLPKFLPTNEQLDAAARAIDINPTNRPMLEGLAVLDVLPTPNHLAVLTSKYWKTGEVKLTVGFLDGAPANLRARILDHMNAWSKYAAVEFVQVANASDAQVRITRGPTGYWSYLGTDILSIPKNQPTMNLQGFTMNTPEEEFIRVVRHETGHTIGAPHEHMRRQIVNRLDRAKTIQYFMRTQGWSEQEVVQQVLIPLEERSILGTVNADEESIMCYQLPGNITTDGRPIVGGVDINANDAAFIAKIYPKSTVTPPPSGGTGLTFSVNPDAKEMIINAPAGWTIKKPSGDLVN